MKKTTAKKNHLFRNTLIVLILCGLIGTIIAAVQFKNTAGSATASASIEFSFDGAAKGLAPDGEKFDLSALTSDGVLTAALETAGLQDRYKAEEIRPQITVNGVFPEKIVEQLMSYESLLNFSANRTLTLSEYHPTLYSVTLKSDFDRNISQADLQKLLGAIMDTFCTTFKQVHSESIGDFTISVNLDDYDYPQQLTIITRRLNQSAEYAQEMYEKDPTLTVNGQGFNSIYVRLNNLVDSDIARLNANITMNALTKNTDRLTTQYLFEIRNLNNELAKKQDQLKKMEALIASYDKNEIIYLSTTDSLTKIDGNSSETYDQLVEQRKKVADEIAVINSDIASYQLRLNDLLKTEEAEETANLLETVMAADPEQPAAEEAIAEAVTMSQEEIEAAARAAEEATAQKTAALEASIQELLDKRTQIMTEFETLIKAFNEKQINDMTVTVTAVRYSAPKLLSGAFAKQVLRTAGPICVVGFMVCLVYIIIVRRKEEDEQLSTL